jgi:hypothetical protein
MDLPMGFGRPQDMTRFLPTPKPIGVLTKYKFAYTVDDNRNTMRQGKLRLDSIKSRERKFSSPETLG